MQVHMIHNTVKTASRVFSAAECDVEAFVLKVYSEFSCSAKKSGNTQRVL